MNKNFKNVLFILFFLLPAIFAVSFFIVLFSSVIYYTLGFLGLFLFIWLCCGCFLYWGLANEE